MKHRKILYQMGILPIKNWSKVFFIFKKTLNTQKRNNIVKYLIKKTHIPGLYIYCRYSKILYIGKGYDIYGRLKSHYIESLERKPYDKKGYFHEFFSKLLNKKVCIYYKKIKSDIDRSLYELMLQHLLKPSFNEYHKKCNNKKDRMTNRFELRLNSKFKNIVDKYCNSQNLKMSVFLRNSISYYADFIKNGGIIPKNNLNIDILKAGNARIELRLNTVQKETLNEIFMTTNLKKAVVIRLILYEFLRSENIHF